MIASPLTSAARADGLHHEALLYRGRGELESAVREFAADAAVAGEPVLAALAVANLSWLQPALAGDATNVHFENMSEVGRNPSRILPMIEDWLDVHDGRARIISEPIWPERSYAETAECLRHEALLNDALAGSATSIMCPYDAVNLAPGVLEGAELTHPRVRDAGGRRRSERYVDPSHGSVSELWPLDEPAGPMSEHVFVGDLGSLRRAVLADPFLDGLTRERREDVVFVVNEAATNVIKHGNGRCTARLWQDGPSVVSEVSFDTILPDILAGRRRPHADAIGGRGLWLINQICDLVQLRSGGAGTTLRMHVS